MDDATNERYSMFFVAEDDAASSFRGVQEVIEKGGLFSSFYSDSTFVNRSLSGFHGFSILTKTCDTIESGALV